MALGRPSAAGSLPHTTAMGHNWFTIHHKSFTYHFNMFGRYTDYAYEPEKRRYRDLLSYSLYPAVYEEFRCGV